MTQYMRERNDDITKLPSKLRETMAYVGRLDERIQIICGMIDDDVGRLAGIRARWINDKWPTDKSKVL